MNSDLATALKGLQEVRIGCIDLQVLYHGWHEHYGTQLLRNWASTLKGRRYSDFSHTTTHRCALPVHTLLRSSSAVTTDHEGTAAALRSSDQPDQAYPQKEPVRLCCIHHWGSLAGYKHSHHLCYPYMSQTDPAITGRGCAREGGGRRRGRSQAGGAGAGAGARGQAGARAARRQLPPRGVAACVCCSPAMSEQSFHAPDPLTDITLASPLPHPYSLKQVLGCSLRQAAQQEVC